MRIPNGELMSTSSTIGLRTGTARSVRLHSTRPRVDALLQIRQGRSLLLLDFVERERNAGQHPGYSARSRTFGNACSARWQFA
jgi:hypothetical protein